jgi:hypothetical protein
MKRGTGFLAPAWLLRVTLCTTFTLAISSLPADDGPLILGPPPSPAEAPPPPGPGQNILPPPPLTTGPQPGGPQPGGPQTSGPQVDSPPLGAPSSTATMVLPLLPVPQATNRPLTPPAAGPTAGGSAGPGPQVFDEHGNPIPGPEGPIPENGPPAAANPGPPRLRMSETKDGKAVEPETAAIPASIVFRTRDIVRPDLLRGKNYRLAEYTPLVDFNFRFEIETPWGTIPAHGMAMLDLRLRELCALEYGSRIADKNPLFTAGFAQAICQTPQGAYIFVTDPIGSVRRTAQAVKRLVVAKKSPGGCRANCEGRRQLACLIGCDPETRNEPLQCLLDDMTINASGGWLAVEVGLNFGLPGLGFLPANTQFKKTMEHRSSREIQADLNTELIELGIPEASRTRFFNALTYTTTQRMAFAFYLHKLIGIENLASLVDGAADTHNESEALASIRELQLICDLRRTRPLVHVTFIGVPVVTLDDGTQIIVTAADYLVESPRTAQMIAAYRTTFVGVPTKLATLGRVSTGAQHQFTAADIEVLRWRLGQSDAYTAKPSATRTAAAPKTPDPASSSDSSAASPATRS